MRQLPFALRVALVLAMGLGIGYALHFLARESLGINGSGDSLLRSYLLNGAAALGIVWGLFAIRRRARFQIGFLFIGGSLLKFALYFVFLHPLYNADGDLSRQEFAAFFVPYGISLILETLYTAQMLRELESGE